MSYVAGSSLQERLDSEGPLDIKETLRIGMQTASGLAAAHAQGLVHRDVKPANILLENSVGRVWLTDFGLARAVDDASLTQSGVIAGTPQYMAPEQAQGHAVDHRADLFSLGSTLYAMCTARAPFRAETAMAVLRRVCDDKPRPVRTLNLDVPAWLAGIVDKLHAKKPADRFQTAAEVADLLEKCLAHVQQPDTNPLPKGLPLCDPPTKGKRPRRRSVGLVLLLLIGLAGALGLGLLLLIGLAGALGLGWSRLPDRQTQGSPGGDILRQNTFGSDSATSANQARPVEARIAQTEQAWEIINIENIEQIWGWAAAVEADLKQPSVAGAGDPTFTLLEQTRRRLEALEKQLTTKAP
jgi:hypothetical protein